MSKYTELLGAVSPSFSGARKARDIVAALTPPVNPSATPAAPTPASPPAQTKSAAEMALRLVPGVAGAAAGAILWKKHRILGALAGHALAGTAYPVYKGGDDRKQALCQLGVEGAGIGGALLYSKHPVVGWVAGTLAGAAAVAFVPGSTTNKLYEKLKSEIS